MGCFDVDVVGACALEWVNCASGFVGAFELPVFAVCFAVLWRKGETYMAYAV